MAPKATLLLCAAIAAVDGWKAPPQKLLKPLATKLLEASLAVTTLGALPAVAASTHSSVRCDTAASLARIRTAVHPQRWHQRPPCSFA